MLVDLSLYSTNKTFVQTWYLNQDSLKPNEAAARMAVATNVPVIACAFFIGEVSGWPPEVLTSIERLIDFYRYTEIIGISDCYPGRREW